jgi:hypothetical protein
MDEAELDARYCAALISREPLRYSGGTAPAIPADWTPRATPLATPGLRPSPSSASLGLGLPSTPTSPAAPASVLGVSRYQLARPPRLALEPAALTPGATPAATPGPAGTGIGAALCDGLQWLGVGVVVG